MSTVGESRVAIQTTTDGLYLPLEGQRDIRLLEVLPGDDASTVVTTMITVSLDNEPTYAALSYAWGDATQRSIIECNGKSISITTTLADALKAFRGFSAGSDASLKRFQRIWADQLCINQHDVLERNHQVGIMGSVYCNSACAFIWLGPGNVESDRALSFIDSIKEISVEHAILHYDDDDDDGLPDDLDRLDDRTLPSDDQAWASLEALFSRPWFHWSWTVQEPILAPNRMIACGSKILGWDIFMIAIDVCFSVGGRWQMIGNSVIPFLSVHESIAENPGDLRLSQLISTHTKREASDPRDKVYALYGLVRGNQKVPLEISYAMSVEDVYRATVRFCIENEESLHILKYVSEFRNELDLPSWVPDWRARSKSHYHPVSISDDLDFHASSISRPLLVSSLSNDKLILKGFTLDIVERTINIAAPRVNPTDSSPDSWIRDAAAVGVPVCFLQGKIFQTSYDLTITTEDSAFHPNVNKRSAKFLWPESTKWLAAGSQNPIPQAVLKEYTETFHERTSGRLLFLTKDTLGVAPKPTKVGDIVCILLGGNAPFILRPRLNTARTTPSKGAKPKRQSAPKTTPQGITKFRHQGPRKSARVAKQAIEATEWTLIGDCYLHGYMRGEAMETVTEADYMNFTLV